MCPKDKAFLDDLRARGVTITAFDRIYYEDPIYDGTKWTTQHFEGGGSTSGTDMNIVLDKDPNENAATIFHEGVHTGQSRSTTWSEREYEAYTKEEQWRIDHGIPGRKGFRKTDSSGKEVPDNAEIKKFVDDKYPIAVDKPTKPSGPVYKVIGKSPSGDTIIQNVNDPSDVKTRPPKKGDTFAGPEIQEPPGGRPAQTCQLKCP